MARLWLGRIRILEQSSDELPIHFLLLEGSVCVGHVKLCRCLGDSESFYAESVVVSKARRGKGVGSIMMRFCELYVVNQLKGSRIVLQTLDAQVFYEKIGYSPCTPVQYTKFRKPKSDLFLRMNQLMKNVPVTKQTVVKVCGEDRYWLDKKLDLI